MNPQTVGPKDTSTVHNGLRTDGGDIHPYTGWRKLVIWAVAGLVGWAAILAVVAFGYVLWRWPAATLVALLLAYAFYSLNARLR